MTIDKSLTCRLCSASFEFTTGEQDFYAKKGFTSEPSRCPECRQAAARGADGGYTAEQREAGTEQEERELFAAVCSECGHATRVSAHLALGEGPIYCSECFATRRLGEHAATGGWRDTW
jgi:CxxC-x17-CxxC domain-containing protein